MCVPLPIRYNYIPLQQAHMILNRFGQNLVEQKIESQFTPALQDQLVFYCPFSDLSFPMNAKTTMEQGHHVWAVIHRHIVYKKTCSYSSIPFDGFCKSWCYKRKYLGIAAVLNIDAEAHTAPLEQFDGLNIFLCYPSVFSNVFFSQSTSTSYNKVTELVHFSYILHSNSPPVALEVSGDSFEARAL